MSGLRSLQRRDDGVELWAIIPREADACRTYLVRGPDAGLADAEFDRLTGAEMEYERRLGAVLRDVARRSPQSC